MYNLHTEQSTRKRRRGRCGQCDGCQRKDCGECTTCKDMRKFGGEGRLKKECKQRVCTNTVPSSPDYTTNTPPPSILETITRLKSLADKYRKHGIKWLYSHSLLIPTLTYILTIRSGCHIPQSNNILTREMVDSYYLLVLHCQQNLYPQHHENYWTSHPTNLTLMPPLPTHQSLLKVNKVTHQYQSHSF